MQAYLKSSDQGGTVEQVEALTKKHEAFENLVASQEPKVCHDYIPPSKSINSLPSISIIVSFLFIIVGSSARLWYSADE